MPGLRTSLEFMEIQDVEHKTIPLRIQDPGTATAVLVVRDIDAHAGWAEAGERPDRDPRRQAGDRSPTATRSMLVRDIDQRFVEIRQLRPTPDTAARGASPFIEIRLSIAVNDMERTKQVYRDVLGFTVEGETAFAADEPCRR